MAKRKSIDRSPVAFMSYVRFDDEHENGRLTQLREQLSGEVHIQTGEDFPIFQDRNDIKWGQNWEKRIEDSLDEATFLIPILTPSFFNSPACRDEVERFLKREKELDRNDLILPVYYVNCDVLDDEAERKKDRIALEINEHQRADWRDLRFEPWTSPQVGKRLFSMANQIREALLRKQKKEVKQTSKTTTRRQAAPSKSRTQIAAIEASSFAELSQIQAAKILLPQRDRAARTEPPMFIVDSMHRGDFASISDAISAADPGHRILVRPGLYEEGLLIDKPLEIIGDGDAEDIVVRAVGANVILFKAPMGRVANLTLRQGGGGKWYGVDIVQGRLDLENCDISSESLECVAIHGGADPRLRRNRIHDGKKGGVLIYDNGRGTLEDNDIFANASAGVWILIGADPILRRNRIHDGKAGGVFVLSNGHGTLEDNDIFANASEGVSISTGANSMLRRNRIHDGKTGGVIVHNNGLGTLEDNDIFANASAGVSISMGANPMLRRNRIHDDKVVGVLVFSNGQGTLEDNDIFANALAGVAVTGNSNPTVRRNRINRNGREAISVFNAGKGVFEENDLRDNARRAWNIDSDCLADVKRKGNLE